jgi:hypothetical protein
MHTSVWPTPVWRRSYAHDPGGASFGTAFPLEQHDDAAVGCKRNYGVADVVHVAVRCTHQVASQQRLWHTLPRAVKALAIRNTDLALAADSAAVGVVLHAVEWLGLSIIESHVIQQVRPIGRTIHGRLTESIRIPVPARPWGDRYSLDRERTLRVGCGSVEDLSIRLICQERQTCSRIRIYSASTM